MLTKLNQTDVSTNNHMFIFDKSCFVKTIGADGCTGQVLTEDQMRDCQLLGKQRTGANGSYTFLVRVLSNYGKLPFSILEIILSKNNQTSGLILEVFPPENGTQIKIFIHFLFSIPYMSVKILSYTFCINNIS